MQLAGHFSDPDGEALTYSIQLANGDFAPDFIQIDPFTGALSVSPQAGDLGSYEVLVFARDALDQSVSTVFVVEVQANDAPYLVAPLPELIESAPGILQQWALPVDLFADDAPGGALQFELLSSTLDSLPDWLAFDPVTGTLAGNAPKEFEGPYLELVLRASDAFGAWTDVLLTVDVGWAQYGTDEDEYLGPSLGADRLYGGAGRDWLWGGSGNDFLHGEAGDDTLEGEEGSDTYVFAGDFGVDLISDPGEELSHILFADRLAGDFVVGRFMDDLVLTTSAGQAVSIASWFNGASTFQLHFADGTTWDAEQAESQLVPLAQISDFSDFYVGGSDESIDALTGNDQLLFEGSGNVVDGNEGDDSVLAGNGVGVDILRGGAGDDWLQAFGGALLGGDEGSDYLQGMDGAHFFAGGLGDDVSDHYSADPEAVHGMVVAYNLGDGYDSVASSNGNYGVLSLGGGAAPGELWLSVDWEEGALIVELADGGSIWLGCWFDPSDPQGAAGQSILLQYVDGGGSVRVFDLAQVAQGFLSSLLAGSVEQGWWAGEALAAFELAIAPGTAFGGALAIEYGTTGSTRGLASEQIRAVLADPDFGTVAQAFVALNAIEGTPDADSLTGTPGDDLIDGGAGNDSMNGGAGDDTYRFGRDYGADTVSDNDATAGNTDSVQFAVDIASDQIWLRQVGDSLELSIIGTADRMTIAGWYGGDARHVEQILDGDGKLLLDTQVQALVDAMAAFAPPAAGEFQLNAALASQLGPTLAASWQ